MGADSKDKLLPVTDKTNRENKGSPILGAVLKFFIRSIFPTELMNINRCLIKANELSPNRYFMRLLFKNRLIILVAAGPSLLNLGLIYHYFSSSNTITNTVRSVYQLTERAIKSKNIALLETISIPESFWVYCLALVGQFIVMTTLSFILMVIIKKLDPILKDSLKLREYCLSHGFSSEEDNLFLVCKAGIVAKVSKMSGDDLVKDKHIWRIFNKIPKDPIESPTDRSVVFIGNGFQLTKYEFKI